MKKISVSVSSVVLAASATFPAMAEDNGASSFMLEEVVVTAQKRAENSQDVPISIQAFSASGLEKLGATELQDLSASAPSFNVGGIEGSQSQMGIRGVVDYGRNVGVDSRTGIYIDGVYQGRSFSANQPLLGLESVEILRGPQGTLFGKNTVSGAINLNTKNPTEEFEGELRATAGNYGSVGGAVYLSGPLTDKLFASLAVGHEERDGYYDNIVLNQDVGASTQDNVRAKLRYEATDSLELIWAADYGATDSEGPLSTSKLSKPFETTKGFVEVDDVEYIGTSLTINYDLDSEYTFTSISAYREADYQADFDGDYSPFTIEHAFFDEDTDMLSQEFRLVSPQGEFFDWVAGLYYYDGSASTDRSSILFGAPVNTSFGLPPEGLISYLPSTVDTTSYAAYVHGNYRFAADWELTVGVRYTNEEKELDYQQILNVDFPPLGGYSGALRSDDQVDDVSPSIGLNWTVAEEVMLFARYAKAYKSGGWNADFNISNGLGFNDEYMQYDQESVDAYELGVKSTLLDQSLQLNLTAFRSEFTDFHVQDFSTLQYTNAAEAVSQGAELEATYIPTDNLKLTLNATYLDTFFDEYELGGLDLSGSALPYAPEWKTYVGVQYIQPIGDLGELTFNVDYSFTDEQFSDPRERSDQFLDDYDTWNARVTFNPTSDRWQLAGWVKNGDDKAYYVQASNTFLGVPRGVLGAPRTYGLSFSYYLGR